MSLDMLQRPLQQKTDAGIPLDSSLAVGESLIVPTRHTTGTLIEGNFAQCAQAVSNDVSFTQKDPIVVPGQYALAAIDGSNAVRHCSLLPSLPERLELRR